MSGPDYAGDLMFLRRLVHQDTDQSTFKPDDLLIQRSSAHALKSATAVIAHAGMGSIITALEFGKRIIVMPRQADLGEQRNDHQIATAKRFAEQGRIIVAFNEQELHEKLDQLDLFRETEGVSAQASPCLIAAIRAFIETGHFHGGN